MATPANLSPDLTPDKLTSPRRRTPVSMKTFVAILLLIGIGSGWWAVTTVLGLFGRAASKTTDTWSRDLPGHAKLPFLAEYLKLHSEVEDAEFHVLFQDNSGVVPGPSDWDIQAVLRIPDGKLPLWTAGLAPSEPVDLSWGFKLLPNDGRWEIHSEPSIYTRGQTVVAVFKPERIVFKRTKSN